MNRLEIKYSLNRDVNLIELIGVIDEEFKIPGDKIDKFKLNLFNLEKLKSINSTGIREWIKFHQFFPDAVFQFSYCPKFFIDQVNMIKGFMPKNSKIISFYVPYYSDESKSVKNILYREEFEYKGSKISHPELVLDPENMPMELDVIPEKFFKFLSAQI